MDTIKITHSAYKTIEGESLNRNTETGGRLIGCLNCLVVLEATLPGKDAELGSYHFTTDVEEDKRILDMIVRKYQGRVSSMGYWHRHPGNMSHPSTGDLMQAQSLIKDTALSGDKNPLYCFISNIVNGKVKLYAYSLSYGDENFEVCKLILIDDNSEEVKYALKNEPVVIQTKSINFWDDTNFQFYLTTRGKERIKQELKELEFAGYKATALRRQADNRLLLDIQKDGLSLLVIPPIEYPIGAPRFVDKVTGKEITKLSVLYNWNSDFSIKQVLDEVLTKNKQVEVKPVKQEVKMEVQNEDYLFKTLLRGTFDYARFVKDAFSEYLWNSKEKGGNSKHTTYWA